MIAERNQGTADNEHFGVWEILPWYANGTSSAEEDLRVERHLAACVPCQEELERCHRLSAAVKSRDEKAWTPSPGHLAQVMAYIDHAEMTGAVVQKKPSLLAMVRAWIAGTPRPMQWAFAAQCALVLVLAGGLLLTTVPGTSMYETLSRSGEPAAADHAQLRVVFAEDVTGKELRDLLQGIDAQIVHGPSPMGVYTIELPFAATAQDRMNRALATLRSHPEVQLAEPVGVGSER